MTTLTGALSHLTSLVARLPLEDKVKLLTGETAFTLPGNDTIRLAPLAFSDGPTGVRGLKFTGGEPVALFPNATLIAGSWDDAIAEEVGGMLADEAHRQDIHVVLGPTINLHRSPLGGRLFEAYSEDPYLTGRTASAYVRGMQSRGVAACLKHLIANESETQRNFVDSRVSERALREVYLLPFEMASQDAGAWSMMSAYNDINGLAATEHREIQQGIVKDEWGWDGLIMSDWFAVKRTVPSANGGLDLVMPGPDGPWVTGSWTLSAGARSPRRPSTIICRDCCSWLSAPEPWICPAWAPGMMRRSTRVPTRTCVARNYAGSPAAAWCWSKTTTDCSRLRRRHAWHSSDATPWILRGWAVDPRT